MMRGLIFLQAFLLIFPAAAAEEGFPGKGMLDEFFEREVRGIAERCLEGIESAAGWAKRREELRAELREMLGLDPEPPRGDLRPVVTGVIERADLGIAIEKLHFQSVPGLYVTGNLYRPLADSGPLPAVLYLCGHGQVKIDGVAYGSKAHYQHHPTWFAREGYVCLVIDTLQLGEIEGHHHGTYRLDMWWWVSRGYTPAGVEAWNSIRALDYLESRPEVDRKRLGVTGRSGGGIGTWWLAALDDRPLALVPVAGITDLRNHVIDGCIEGHCDCNYPVNLYRWDYPALAALAAPRPLLFSNTDKDRIFPLDGVVRVHEKLRRLYALLGEEKSLGLLITEGPHADTQELRVPAFRWMERWLEERPDAPVVRLAEKLFDPKELKVFETLPEDQKNTAIHETFVPAAPVPEVPADRAGFEALRQELIGKLREKTFRNAPDPAAPLEIEEIAAVERHGFLLRGYRFASEGPFRLPLWVISGAQAREPSLVVINVVDEKGWRDWLTEVAISFGEELGVDPALGDPLRAAALHRMLSRESWAFAILPPRGIGPTRWAEDPKKLNQIRRRFLVLGRTLEECWVHDARRAARAVAEVPALSGAPLWMQAEREMAAVIAYAGIFEPAVKRFELWSMPASHREALPLLNVLKTMDIPQAVSLLLPRKVNLYNAAAEPFDWARRAAALHAPEDGEPPLRIREVPTESPDERAKKRIQEL